jgi:hypothetical protein
VEGSWVVKFFAAASMLSLGFYSFMQSSAYGPLLELLQSKLGVALPQMAIFLFIGFLAIVASAGGHITAHFVHVLAILLFLSSALPFSNTSIFGGLRTAMPFKLVLIAGIIIEGGFLVLVSAAFAERMGKELRRRGADMGSVKEVVSGQLSLSLTYVAISSAVPLTLFFLFMAVSKYIANVVHNIPYPQFSIPLFLGIFALLWIFYYLSSERSKG